MSKHIYALVLGLCIIMALPVSAAYSGKLNDKISWTLTDAGALVITGSGAMPNYSEEHNSPFVDYSSKIKSVIVGNGITSLSDRMCYGCENLTTATLPSTLTRIGSRAFGRCFGLNDFEIPQSVTIIGDYAFYGCASKEVNLPAKLDSIGEGAFYQSGLAKITLPSSLRAIGTSAFESCSGGVTEVTIPEGVKLVGNLAFSIKSLKTINLNAINCNTYVVLDYFGNKTGWMSSNTSITTINIGPNVLRIPDYIAYLCNGLTTVNIAPGSKLREVGMYAFYRCELLERFDAPMSVVKVGMNAFRDTGILLHGTPRQGIYIGSTLCKVIDDNTPFDFYLKEGTKSISYGAFTDTHVEQCVFNENDVTAIDDYAFQGAKYLYAVWLPKGITNLGKYAYANCIKLKSAYVLAPIKKIPEGMFRDTDSRAWMELPKTVEEVGDFAFHNGWSREELPDFPNLKVVGDYAFARLPYLKTVDLPQGVTTIGNGAFSKNTNVTTVNLPTSLRSIGEYAFMETSVTSIVLPEGLKTVGRACFNNCINLKKITLPRSLTYIPEDFATNCGSLSEIYVPHTTPIDFNDMAWTRGNDYYTYEKATVYVPRNCAVTYAMHGKWGRFNHIREYDAPQGATGDVNGDDVVDIADVNAVIDMILGLKSNSGVADVNGDGTVDVADLNAIINTILGL